MGQISDFQPRYFSVADQGDVVIVTFSMTHISDEDNIEDLGHELFGLVEQFDCRKVLLNMKGVEYVTSSVIGKLITLHRKLHRSEGQLVISDLSPGVSEVLQAARLMSYFKVVPTQAEALTLLTTQ